MYLLFALFVALAFGKATLFTYPDAIEGQYIVLYHPKTDDILIQKHESPFGKNVFKHYNITGDFMGYAAYLTKEEVEIIRDDPIVREVHPDTPVYIYDQEQTCNTQSDAPSWGISRVSLQGGVGSNPLNSYRYSNSGSGVAVYVIDTGILLTHTEFSGRAVWGYNAVDSIRSDNNGHGTHCAGTIGGSWVGVAKNARLVAVRVLNGQGSGTNAGVIDGINWVANNHVKPAVASMSLGGGYNTAMNQAVAALVSAGVTTAVAAGNDNSNACNYSPASTPTAICVGATARSDARSTFSNYGNCVHIFAPGTSIYSSWIPGTSAYNTISGTSMACPHVAGLAAAVLSQNPGWTPLQVKNHLISTANSGYITNPGSGSPNRLALKTC